MTDVERLLFEDCKRNVFAEVVADDEFDFIDSMENEIDDTDAESDGDI